MRKHLALALGLLCALTPPPVNAQPSAPQAAQGFANNLRRVTAVEFYFLARTEEWDYRPSDVITHSTIRLYRACGANCDRLMAPVLSHLQHSKPVQCRPGMQNAVIRGTGGWVLVYSYSGRQIRYGRWCYWNEAGIEQVVRDSNVEFGSSGGSRPTANNSSKPTPLRGAA